MIKLKQFYTLTIQDLDESDLPLSYHSQNYYELVYIYHGCGTHLLNQVGTPYAAGDLFTVSQEDTHHFEPSTNTRIIAIKFTNSYFKNSDHGKFQEDMTVNPESIMNNRSLKETKLAFDQEQKAILRHTVDSLLLYSKKGDASVSPVVFYQIMSIFAMIKETMGNMFLSNNKLPAKEKLTTYILQHIYRPEQMKVAYIASHFNISTSYFSAYFKRRFDISYREYINQYRIQLIEQRLASGRFSLKEIANEFGFNDESHFSHYYKNKKNVSPSSYSATLKKK